MQATPTPVRARESSALEMLGTRTLMEWFADRPTEERVIPLGMTTRWVKNGDLLWHRLTELARVYRVSVLIDGFGPRFIPWIETPSRLLQVQQIKIAKRR